MSERRYTNRPMSEYELALFHALTVAFKKLVRQGGDPQQLKRELREPPEGALEDFRPAEAATLQMLAMFVPENEPAACAPACPSAVVREGGRE